MRLKQPLNGIRKSSGHIIFHIAMLIGSFIVLRYSDSQGPVTQPCPVTSHEKPEFAWQILNIIRGVHAFLIASHLLRLCLSSEETDLVAKVFESVEVIMYFGITLYQQFYVLLYPPTQCEDKFVFMTKGWMSMELFIFYSMVLNSILFLAYIQLRGACGGKDLKRNQHRFKFDALDFYDNDIEWVSFMIVPIGLCLAGMAIMSKISRSASPIDNYMLGLILVARLIQLVMMSGFRYQNKAIVEHKLWKWLVLACLELGAAVMFFMQPKLNLCSTVFIVDVFCQVLMFFYYLEHRREQNGQKPSPFALLLPYKFFYYEKVEGIDDEQHIENFIREKYKYAYAHTATVKFEQKELKISKDIYSLAYAAILHPMELEEMDPKKKYMPRIELLNDERDNLYVGAFLTALVQITTIILIVFYFNDGKGISMVPAATYLQLIPRLLSCYLMHLNVLPDIRQGIELMKFAVNHPWKFRPIKHNYDVEVIHLKEGINDDGDKPVERKKKYEEETHEEISYNGAVSRAFFAFLLGFFQAAIGLIAEILVIYFLSSLSRLLDIIMKYVSLAAVVKFDNMYAAALADDAIMGAVGCKLLVSNKRRNRVAKSDEYVNADSEVANSAVSTGVLQGKIDSVKNSCFIKLLRFVNKVFRVYFASFVYYFLPLLSLIVSFLTIQDRNAKSQ